MGMPSFTKKYVGPDDLKNLYSDPAKNKANQPISSTSNTG